MHVPYLPISSKEDYLSLAEAVKWNSWLQTLSALVPMSCDHSCAALKLKKEPLEDPTEPVRITQNVQRQTIYSLKRIQQMTCAVQTSNIQSFHERAQSKIPIILVAVGCSHLPLKLIKSPSSILAMKALAAGITLISCICHVAESGKYLIGQDERAGAYEVTFDEEKTTLDLSKDCYPGKVCPPVVVMIGRQVGTIEVSNCHEGVMYTFINKGELDAGVVVQHEGGLYGSKGIPQFGMGSCFCYREGNLMCG